MIDHDITHAWGSWRMKRKPEKCLWCEKLCTHLCDQIIGRALAKSIAADPGEAFTEMANALYTCDAPMCREHSSTQGWISGGERPSGRIQCLDTFDFCKFHRVMAHELDRLITPEEADAYRRRMAIAVSNGLQSAEHGRFYGQSGTPAHPAR